jgi:hypothetical protein
MRTDDAVVPPPEDVFNTPTEEASEEGEDNLAGMTGCIFVASIFLPFLIPMAIFMAIWQFFMAGHTSNSFVYNELREIIIDDIDDETVKQKETMYRENPEYPKDTKTEWLEVMKDYCLEHKSEEMDDDMYETMDKMRNHDNKEFLGVAGPVSFILLFLVPPIGVLGVIACIIAFCLDTSEEECNNDRTKLERRGG